MVSLSYSHRRRLTAGGAERQRNDGGDARDAADGLARWSSLDGFLAAGDDLDLPSEPEERCSACRQGGCAYPWEHPSLPRRPSPPDQRLLRKVSTR